jgi:hypothetical protein
MTRPVVVFATRDIRHFVAHILNGPASERRVALVAFVGRSPKQFAERWEGVEVVCWPAPGATSGDGVRELLKAGATVQFAHGMHRKVYWSETRGALVGSANLSWSALGQRANAEACVYFPDSAEVPITEMLAGLAWDADFAARLADLDRAPEPKEGFGTPPPPAGPFDKWSMAWRDHDAGHGPPPRRWKVSFWLDNELEHSKAAKTVATSAFGVDLPADFTTAAAEDTYEPGDWVLQIHLGRRALSRPSWLRVQRVMKVQPGEADAYDEGYPFHAVEFDVRDRPPEPFSLEPADPVVAALSRWAAHHDWSGIEGLTNLLAEPPAVVRNVLFPIRARVDSFPAFYRDFWPQFRALVGDLPTGSGWHRRPEDLDSNYDGARSRRWNNVYAHVGFVDRGGRRRLAVEWYEADHRLDEWKEFLGHVASVKPPAALVVEHEEGKLFERRRAYLTEPMALADMVERRDTLLRQAADAYRIMAAHLN